MRKIRSINVPRVSPGSVRSASSSQVRRSVGAASFPGMGILQVGSALQHLFEHVVAERFLLDPAVGRGDLLQECMALGGRLLETEKCAESFTLFARQREPAASEPAVGVDVHESRGQGQAGAAG